MGPGSGKQVAEGANRLFVMCQSHHEHPFVSTAFVEHLFDNVGGHAVTLLRGCDTRPARRRAGRIGLGEQMFAIALRPIYAVVQTGVRVARAPTAEGATMAEVLKQQAARDLEFIADACASVAIPLGARDRRGRRPQTPRRPSTPIWRASNVRATSSATPPSPAPSRFASTLRRRSRWPPPHALRPVGR